MKASEIHTSGQTSKRSSVIPAVRPEVNVLWKISLGLKRRTVTLSEMLPQKPACKNLPKMPFALRGGLLELSSAIPQQFHAHGAGCSPRLWEQSWTCRSSSPLPWTMPSLNVPRASREPVLPVLSLLLRQHEQEAPPWGQELGRGSWQAQRVWRKDRFSRAVKGNGAWKGKLGLPGGRDKAKLKSKSLEASWEKTWKQTGNGRKMGMGVKNTGKLSHLLAASVWNAPRMYRILLQRWTMCRRAKLFLSSFRISFHIADGLHRYQYNNVGLNCWFFLGYLYMGENCTWKTTLKQH